MEGKGFRPGGPDLDDMNHARETGETVLQPTGREKTQGTMVGTVGIETGIVKETKCRPRGI